VTVEWVVLLPLKRLSLAKSRLTCPGPGHRQAVARAMAETVALTASQVSGVGQVVVVTDEHWDRAAAPVELLPEPRGGGLNAALGHAAATLVARRPDRAVAALLADTAAATVEELSACLAAAARHPRAFVADAEGAGTVLLTAAPGIALRPRFGVGSRVAHDRSGAVDLTDELDVPFLRRDLDTAADLSAVAGRLLDLPRMAGALRDAGWTGEHFRTSVAATVGSGQP
jgi:2-phospho-L-lactate guanylyltransferase